MSYAEVVKRKPINENQNAINSDPQISVWDNHKAAKTTIVVYQIERSYCNRECNLQDQNNGWEIVQKKHQKKKMWKNCKIHLQENQRLKKQEKGSPENELPTESIIENLNEEKIHEWRTVPKRLRRRTHRKTLKIKRWLKKTDQALKKKKIESWKKRGKNREKKQMSKAYQFEIRDLPNSVEEETMKINRYKNSLDENNNTVPEKILVTKENYYFHPQKGYLPLPISHPLEHFCKFGNHFLNHDKRFVDSVKRFTIKRIKLQNISFGI